MKAINLLQQTTILGFIGSTILFSPFATHALTVEEVTNPRRVNGGWVADMADILSDRTETKLNSLITNQQSTASPRETNSTKTAQSDRSFGSALFPIVFLNIIFIVGWFYNRKHHRRGAGSKHSTSGIFGSSKKSRRRSSRYSRSSYSSFGSSSCSGSFSGGSFGSSSCSGSFGGGSSGGGGAGGGF